MKKVMLEAPVFWHMVGALSESLRRELRGSGVAVSCLFPAPFFTFHQRKSVARHSA